MEFKSKLKPFVKKHKKPISMGIIAALVAVPILAIILPPLIDYYYEEPKENGDEDIDSLLWRFGSGMPGEGASMQPQKVTFEDGGEEFIVIGTDGGIATLSLDGVISMSYMTFGDVIAFDLINDLSGDGLKDIVLVVYDRDHANVIAIASDDGREIWKYDPRVKGYDSETFAVREFTTYTWDVEVVDDIDDQDGQDVVISSWNRIIALEGDEGDEIWVNDDACTNDIWNIEQLDDKIIAGSEAGELVAVDMDTGELEWTSEIAPSTTILVRSLAVVVEKEVDSSIDDILISGDDIIVSTDDGYLYAVSGDDGEEIDSYELYEIPEYDDEVGSTNEILTSPYSCERRIFQHAGMKLLNTIDINGDGSKEYIAIAYHLEYSDEDFNNLEEVEFEGVIFNFDGDSIEDISGGEFDYDNTLYTASYPEFINVGSKTRGYFFRNNFEGATGQGSNYQGIYYNDYFSYGLDSSGSSIVVRTGDDWDDDYDDTDTVGKYLLNVGDTNDDGVDDLFAIGDDGKYMLIDTKNGQILWSRSKATGGTELIQIEDIDGDKVRDFLFQRISSFDPTWREFEGEDMGVNCWQSYKIQDGDPTEDETLISEFLTISGATGRVIWETKSPINYYEGFRDIVNIGDIDDDNIDDYAGWIMPSAYPPELEDYIKDLTGQSTVSITSYDEDGENNYREEAINRALLAPYTRFLAISGKNAEIIWERPLVDFPYKYYRDFKNDGTFISPSGLESKEGDIYHRTYGEIPNSWHNPLDRNDILWYDYWPYSTLTHATEVGLESGNSTDSFFDLFGLTGDNHTITSTDATADIKTGAAVISSSEDTEKEDNNFWTVDSVSSGGKQRIAIEMAFNQPLDLGILPNYLIVDYIGNLSKVVDEIEISIFDFFINDWRSIGPNSINSTTVQTWQFLEDEWAEVVDFVDDDNNNLVKIRIDAEHSSSFDLSIDELVVNYLYELGNYTIKAEDLDEDNIWQIILNFTIPLEFGTDYHALTQIERISALKLQTMIAANITIEPADFKYEIYNENGNTWEKMQIDASQRTLDNNDYNLSQWIGRYNDDTTNPGGFRNNHLSFNLTTTYRNDSVFVIQRGTYNTTEVWGVDNGVRFDYENKSLLTPFLGSDNTLRLRITINHTSPFNISIDSFGVALFYWGVFGNEWDQYYVYNLETDQWDENLDNILNLKIQDFEVINGNGDEYPDVLVVAGFETCSDWSSRLILYDVKNQSVSTQWGHDCRAKVPYNRVSATYLNHSLNGWILSGTFQVPSTKFSHRYINDADWDNAITNYDNYIDPTISYNDAMSLNYSQWSFYEIPGTTEYKSGKLGLILGDYDTENNLQRIKIIDPYTQSLVCYINLLNLDPLGRSEWTRVKNDFRPTYIGYKIKFSYADLTGDGYYEHLASAHWGRSIRIFSGSSGSPGDAIVDIDLEEIIEDGKISENYEEGNRIVSDERTFTLPFAYTSDLNEDNILDGIIGTQSCKSGWDDNLYSKGAAILPLDIAHSSGVELEKIEPDEWDYGDDVGDDDDDDDDDDSGFAKEAWELEPYEQTYDWEDVTYEFFDVIENIGDFNGDGKDEIICSHNTYTRSEDAYITGSITDLLDIYNQELLYRFNLGSVDGIYLTDDFTGDRRSEFIIASGESFFCINSEFEVEFSDLEDDEDNEMSSSRFTIEWETDADYDFFELIIDGNVYNRTESLSCKVSLGPGEKNVQIFMYDKSGIVIAVDEVTIIVPVDYSMFILTAIIAVVISALVIFYKRNKKRKANIVLVDKEKEMEEIQI